MHLCCYSGGADVFSLRAAASAAVAECTGGLGIVGASVLSRSHIGGSDSARVPASGGLGSNSQDSQSLGSVVHNTRSLSIQPGKTITEDTEPDAHDQQHDSSWHSMDALHACPPHGAKAICGRRPKMEDAYTAIPFLLEVPIPQSQGIVSELIPPRIATHVKAAPGVTSEHEGSIHSATEASTPVTPQGTYSPFMETLHFFGVFDGHGGAEAALHCAQTLHQRIAEALSAVSSPDAADRIKQSLAASQAETAAKLGSVASNQPVCKCPEDQACTCDMRKPNKQLSGSFSDARLQPLAEPKQGFHSKGSDSDDSEETDHVVKEALQEHRRESRQTNDQQPAAVTQHAQQPPSDQQLEAAELGDTDSDASAATTTKIESALTNAFTRADEEFGKADNAALVGTTAVVALVGSKQLYVANCGKYNVLLAALAAVRDVLHISGKQAWFASKSRKILKGYSLHMSWTSLATLGQLLVQLCM